MKKTLLCLMTLLLFAGCGMENTEPVYDEIETVIAEDTYTIGTTTPERIVPDEKTEQPDTEKAQVFTGLYINIDNPYEQWHFFSDGTARIAGEEYSFQSERNDHDVTIILSNGERYSASYVRSGKIILNSDGGEITLYEEGDPEVYAAREKYRLFTEKAELFEKYPDEYGWMQECGYGDIPYLADAEYIEKSLESGIFSVGTPEELASFNYLVNTSLDGQYLFMQLRNDIDLSGYDWVPMGWYGGEADLPFTCLVDGNSCTISNMTINCTGGSVGFVGWETGCGVYNLTFENASVSGGSMVGIVAGQAIGGYYENCHVSGTVNGSSAGSMIGHDASHAIIDCTADVIVNGEEFDFLTWNDKEKSEIVIENPVEITIDESYTITRPEVEGYANLGWMIYKDGIKVLHRNAENELSYQYFVRDPGEYTVYLIAWVEGQYVPISNIITYTIR